MMNKQFKRWVFLLLCSCAMVGCLLGQSQPYIVEVEHLGVKDGLLGRKVYQIHEDKQGIIWVLTTDGLNRYDGRDFKWYKEFAVKNYFEGTLSICEDAEGFLWLFESTTNKVSLSPYLVNTHTGKLLPFNEKIKRLPFDWADIVSTSQGTGGAIHLLSKTNQLFTYESSGSFSKLQLDQETKPLKLIAVDEQGIIWAKLNKSPSFFSLIKFDSLGQTVLLKDFVESGSFLQYCGVDQDNRSLFFYILDEGGTSLFFSILGEKVETQAFASLAQVPDSILLRYSKVIQSGKPTEKFLSTNFGLKVLDPSGQVVYDLIKGQAIINNIKATEFYENSLFNKKNIIWLKSSQGFFKIHFKEARFQLLPVQETQQANGISCRNILRGSNGDLLISHNKGLSIYRQSKLINSNYLDLPAQCNSVIEDQDNNYWFAVNDNLMRAGTVTGLAFDIGLDELINGRRIGQIYSLYQVNSSSILFGGAYIQGRYDAEKHSVSTFKQELVTDSSGIPRSFLLYQFQQDREGKLWGCTNLGLVSIDLKNMTINSFWQEGDKVFQLPKTEAHHFYQDEEGIYWIAGKHLTRWNRETNESKVFTTADGFPSSILHAVYPDDYGNLWLSTENGIACFNKITHQVKKYTETDGILHNEFNRISHFKDKDGTIYFGGINGVTAFHPRDLLRDDGPSQETIDFVITEFDQFSNKENKMVDMLTSVLKNNEIVLEPNDRFFRIQFTLPHYIKNEQIQYDFKIGGYQEEWLSIQENYIMVSGLPYGDYSLQVKAKFPTGLYNGQELYIPIRVLRPFYMTSWFLILAIGSLFVIGLFLIERQDKRLNMQRLVLENLVEERTAIIQAQNEALESSNDFKDRLFTIIAHDLRNAVYSFTGVTKVIKTYIKLNRPEKILEISGAIDSSTDQLQHLLDNLLDWALSQRGETPYKPELISLETLFDSNINVFKDIASQRSVSLEKEIVDEFQLYADKNALNVILRNLIGNAIKYTPEDGCILLSAIPDGEHGLICIKDTGTGIPPENLSKIFVPNRHKIQEGLDGHRGSGIGLLLVKELVELNNGSIKVESILGKGTSFYLEFPNP